MLFQYDRLNSISSVDDVKNMEGERFLTYNFATFSKDAGVWSYRDIQKLCVSLGISARGKRGQLVRKLAEWHRSRYEDDS